MELPIIEISQDWKDYELLDSGDGRRLERFGKYVLNRPDPGVIWKKSSPEMWSNASAIFERTTNDRGKWIQNVSIPERWPISYNNISFWVKLSPFKHTGVFPEQSVQWDYIYKKIKNEKRPVNVLNLFAYTGIASLFVAKAGAKVTHLDASRPAVTWANENRDLNQMGEFPIRWIIDDALSFTEREIKRGVKYDAVIMDPPAYGHGPTGDIWDFNRDFPNLLANCKRLLSDNPLFVMVNTYAISSSSITLANSMADYFSDLGGTIKNGELAIRQKSSERLLSTGIWARWENVR
jgi:23S rRNA (cytosine1962-C5)-methyltransferase